MDLVTSGKCQLSSRLRRQLATLAPCQVRGSWLKLPEQSKKSLRGSTDRERPYQIRWLRALTTKSVQENLMKFSQRNDSATNYVASAVASIYPPGSYPDYLHRATSSCWVSPSLSRADSYILSYQTILADPNTCGPGRFV